MFLIFFFFTKWDFQNSHVFYSSTKIYMVSQRFPQNWADAHIYLCASLNKYTLYKENQKLEEEIDKSKLTGDFRSTVLVINRTSRKEVLRKGN